MSTKSFNWSSIVNNVCDQVFSKRNTQKVDTYNDIILCHPWVNMLQKSNRKLKYKQMCVGQIWQKLIGHCEGFINLGQGHPTKLDIMTSSTNPIKCIIELKNRYNTCNSSSKETTYNNLIEFKKTHLDHEVIFGIINCNTTNNCGKDYIVNHKGYDIRYLSGDKFLQFIFGDDFRQIIDLLKNNTHIKNE